MGAWGTSLYSNDTTSDVRDTYIEYLQIQQMNNQDAYDNTMKKFNEYLGNPDEEPLFWYAIADTQWKVGRLSKEVKQKAMEWIDKKGGIEVWEESKKGSAGWQKTLDKLRVKLETEQPKEKKFRKLIISNQNPWELNDVYAYQIHKEYGPKEKHVMNGKFILLQKIGETKSHFTTDNVMLIQVYDKLFDFLPSIEEAKKTVKNCRLLPLSNPENQLERFVKNLKNEPDPFVANRLVCEYNPVLMSGAMEQYFKDFSYPKDKLTFICSTEPRFNLQHERKDGNVDCFYMWSNFNSQIAWIFSQWKEVEYDIISDGTFEYPTLEQQRKIKSNLNL